MVILQSIKQYLPLITLACITLLFGILAFFIPHLVPSKKVVSGIFHINGIIPAGSSITLFAREESSKGEFSAIASKLTPNDLASWQFTGVISGKSYQIKAGIVTNGKIVYYSNSITVTSPSFNQVLTFNVPTVNPSGQASVKGIITINGYIPVNTHVDLEATESGKQNTRQVLQTLLATSQVTFHYQSAIAGKTYQIQASLYDRNNKLIGQSPVQTIVAPAANTNFTVQSTALSPITPKILPVSSTPPISTQIKQLTPTPVATTSPALSVSQASISGTILFTGQAPLNSRIVIFQKVSEAQNYQIAADNLSPSNNTTWFWTGGTSGTIYNLLAILKQKQSNGSDIDAAYSNVLSIAAPASNQIFTINSSAPLAAPPPNITVACNSYNGSAQTWPALVSFETVTGAQSYWFKIGTTDGGSDLVNSTQNAQNSLNQILPETFKNGTTYFAKYAYSALPNLYGGDPQFSPLSSSVQLKCSQ